MMNQDSIPPTMAQITIRRPVGDHVTTLENRLLQIHPIELQGGMIDLKNADFFIGRDPVSDLTIPDQSVSRRHCCLQPGPNGGYWIADLKSTNGTWVNEKQIEEEVELTTGDRIRIGNRIFKFISTDEVESYYHDAVYAMMTRDGLTGAWNRRYFQDQLGRELKRHQRSQQSIAVLMIDLDHFKELNDTYGHLVGDSVLSALAKRIQNQIRNEDILSRFGGEEFALILSETDQENALAVAERCRSAIADFPFSISDGEVSCSISIGVAIADDGTPFIAAEELLGKADANLYQAKSRGRNQVFL